MLLIGGILILVVLPLTLFYCHYHFYRSAEKEVYGMFHFTGKKEKMVAQKDLEDLPEKLQDYLLKAGIINTCKDCHMNFKQIGPIKIV